MRKSTPKTLKHKLTDKNYILKTMVVTLTITVLVLSTTVCAFADSNAESAVKEFYNQIVGIVKIAGAILGLYGIVQIGVSLSQTHDAAQRMNGILMLVGGALLFFGEDLLSTAGITVG